MTAAPLYSYPRPVWARIQDRSSSLLDCVPKRFRRFALFTTTAIVSLILFVAWCQPTSSDLYPDTWGRLTHGRPAVDNPPTSSFPTTPLRSKNITAWEEDRESKPWLAAVISTANDFDRRVLIRATWMEMYKDVPFDGRFVIANPGERWMDMVKKENQTHGDIIVLDSIPEDRITANSIKTLEFYKWLLSNSRRYEFVSKIDTDLFLNARGFWDRYLLPRLSFNETDPTAMPKATVERTTIGQLYYSRPNKVAYPHGSMYTNTWDMIELLAKLQDKYYIQAGEDRAVTLLLQRENEVVNLVNMRGSEKFDFDPSDTRQEGLPWARAATHANAKAHALSGTDAIGVHKVKTRESFMQVAEAFDSKGLKSAPPMEEGQAERTPPFWTRLHDLLDFFGVSTHFETQISRVPSSAWKQEADGGDWICDRVWNVGASKTGFQNES